MTERDDDLLKTFFEEYAINIPDNGFSQQVMRQLPHRFLKANQVWFWFCTLVGIAFLVLSDAMEQLRTVVNNFIGDIHGFWASFDLDSTSPLTVYMLALVLALISGFYIFNRDVGYRNQGDSM